MQEKDWLALVAVHSDAWLLSVTFYIVARYGFDKADRLSMRMYWLTFTATAHPLGFSTNVILSGKLAAPASVEQISYPFDGSQISDVQVGSGNLKLVYSGSDGKLGMLDRNGHVGLCFHIFLSLNYVWSNACYCITRPG